MTSKEALKMLETRCRFYATDNIEIEETYKARELIEKDLEVLEFFKKLFVNTMPIQLTDLQDGKYLSIPSSDIRRPDALLPLSEKEYELLKEWFKNNLLKEWLKENE